MTEKVHEYACKLTCYCVTATYAVQEVIRCLSKQCDVYKNLTDVDPERAFSSVISACKESLGYVKSIKYSNNKDKLYASKGVVKEEVNVNAFDITALIDFLENLPAFPLCKIKYIAADVTHVKHGDVSCGDVKKVCCAICLHCTKCKKDCKFIELCSKLRIIQTLRNYYSHKTYENYAEIEAELKNEPPGPLATEWKKNLKSWEEAIKWLLGFLKKHSHITEETYGTKVFEVDIVKRSKKEVYWNYFNKAPELKLLVNNIPNKRLEFSVECDSTSPNLKKVKDLNSQPSKIFQSIVEMKASDLLEKQLCLENSSEKYRIDMDTMKFTNNGQQENLMCVCATFHVNGNIPDSFNKMTSKEPEKLRLDLTNLFQSELCKIFQAVVKVTCVGWEFHSIHVHFEINFMNSEIQALKSVIQNALSDIIKISQVGSILKNYDLENCDVDISFKEFESCVYSQRLTVGFTITIYDDGLIDTVEKILPSIETELHSEISKKIAKSSYTQTEEKFEEYIITEKPSQSVFSHCKLGKGTILSSVVEEKYNIQPTIKNRKAILNEDIYSYDVDIDDIYRSKSNNIVAAKLALQYPMEFPSEPVCDGDFLYTKHPISSSKIVLSVTDEDGTLHQVVIKLRGKVNLVDLKKAASSMVKEPGIKGVLNQARKLCYNPISMTYVTHSGAVNVSMIWSPWSDFSSTAFIKHWEMNFLSREVFHKSVSVIEYLHELTGFDATKSPRKLTEKERKLLLNHIKDFEVKLTYDGTQFYVNDVMTKGPKELTFEKKQPDGIKRKYTIEEYFKHEKQTTLKYPDLPCLHVGSVHRNIYIPMELCNLMSTEKRLIVPYKCLERTDDNFKHQVNEMLQDLEQNATVSSWGLVFHNIEAPIPEEDVEKFQTELIKSSASVGLKIGPPLFCEKFSENDTAERVVCEAFERDRKIEFLLVVLNGRSKFYGNLKNICESELGYNVIVDGEIKSVFKERGLVTQGVTLQNFQKHNKELVDNLSIQLREKIGAVLTEIVAEKPERPLHLFKEPVIFIGASLTFQASGECFAAVVGSVDHLPMRYEASVFLQTNEKVLNAELYALQKACTGLHPDYQPGITFISVKRKPFLVDEKKILNVPGYCHAGFKESRPFIYHILWDDSGFAIEDLKKLSIFLCHASPCYYYAHLVSERMKYFITTKRKNKPSEGTRGSGKMSYDITERMKQHPALGNKFLYTRKNEDGDSCSIVTKSLNATKSKDSAGIF
ncbi:uncharacterized protein LOC130636751 isoform X2 [Hydractinia symbiolongicarpus]|uniref:uncharacterized protein LOC130636751 isoform X2 n=1 Tax=Hydractinia symbiolongicarpus TaxID=13093 RepID=UPI00254B5EC0|nr:uncharacterized protein LOC130636751 isoform X2 [Hydractinia symbiolongicarpus]